MSLRKRSWFDSVVKIKRAYLFSNADTSKEKTQVLTNQQLLNP